MEVTTDALALELRLVRIGAPSPLAATRALQETVATHSSSMLRVSATDEGLVKDKLTINSLGHRYQPWLPRQSIGDHVHMITSVSSCQCAPPGKKKNMDAATPSSKSAR